MSVLVPKVTHTHITEHVGEVKRLTSLNCILVPVIQETEHWKHFVPIKGTVAREKLFN